MSSIHSASSNQPIRRDIERVLRQKGLLPQALAAWILTSANTVAKGRFVAKRFRNGELLCMTGSLPAAELQLRSPQFLEAINKKIGRPLVKSIRFKQQ